MFTQNLKRGFTLIELLVVISIVGALASVVLSSVNVARDKGADAAIKSNLANMRVQAALLFDNDGCYTATPGDCVQAAAFPAASCSGGNTDNLWRSAQITEALNAAGRAFNGTGIAAGTCYQAINGGVWAIIMPLKSNSAKAWCIDSIGRSKERNVAGFATSC